MSKKKPSIAALTGLRFIAALTVFIHHLSGRFGFELNPYSIGSAAVTFFFVLSGFVLVYVYHDRLGSMTEVRRFYFNRFARIWPLHVACLIISILTLSRWERFEHADTWKQLWANVFLIQSWFVDRDWIFAFNGVSWSISTEAFFYLIFPLMAFGAARWFRYAMPCLLLAVLAGGLVFYQLCNAEHPPSFSFSLIGQVNPLLRLVDFLIGVLAGYVFLKRRMPEPRPFQYIVDTVQEICIAILIVAVCVWVTDSRFSHQIIRANWGGPFLGGWFRVEYLVVLFGIAVYTFAKSNGLLARIASHRVLVYLGDVSYAFYMIHFTVIRNVYQAHSSYGELNGFALATLTFLISLGLAILLFEWIEIPAKSFLKSWYERTGNHGALFPNHFLLLKTVIAVSMVVGSMWLLTTKITKFQRSPEFSQIVRQSKPEYRNVNFGSQMRLMGVKTTRKKKKLEIKFAWLKRIHFPHRRLVTVINKSQKQVARGQHNQEAIQNALPGQFIVDTAYVALDDIKGKREIVISFRDGEKGGMFVDKGIRRLRDRALVIPIPPNLNGTNQALPERVGSGKTEEVP